MYQLAIFDLDGTLLDTLADLHAGVNHALAAFGYAPRTLDEVRTFVGNGAQKLIARAVPAGTSQAQQDAVLAEFQTYYGAHCADLTKPYDGILPLLAQLQKDGVQTAVVSNKPDFAVQTLAAQYFPGLLAASAGAKDGVRKKPYPDAVLAVVAQPRASAPSTSAIPRWTWPRPETRSCPASRSAGASARARSCLTPAQTASATASQSLRRH